MRFDLFLHPGTTKGCQVIKSERQKAGRPGGGLDKGAAESRVLSTASAEPESFPFTPHLDVGRLGLCSSLTAGVRSQGMSPVLLPVTSTLFKDLRQRDHCFCVKSNQMWEANRV